MGMHLTNSATDEFDHDRGMALIAREQEAVNDFHGAIQRILAGTCGICETTKVQIPVGRLCALPGWLA